MSIPLYHTFFCPSNLGGWQRLKKEKKILTGNNGCETLSRQTTKIIRILEETGTRVEFDESIFKMIVGKVWIADNESIIYELVNGVNIQINISEV